MEHLLTLILILHFSSQGCNSLMALLSMRTCFFGLIAFVTESTVKPYRNYGNSSIAWLVTMETRARHSNTVHYIRKIMYWFVYLFIVFFHEEPLYLLSCLMLCSVIIP